MKEHEKEDQIKEGEQEKLRTFQEHLDESWINEEPIAYKKPGKGG